MTTAPTARSVDTGPRALLDAVFAPASVALIGASDNPTKLITYRPIEYLRRYGYGGAIYPINPKYDHVQGLPAYASVRDTPTAPELVLLALPREHVLTALEECAAIGTKVAIVYSSGFAEVGDGCDLQEELTALATRTGLRIIGPNCQGVATLSSGYLPCFSTAFATDAPEPGRAAILSQSGAVAAMIYNHWTAVGGGAKYWASTGNESNLTVAQLARAAVEDDEIDTLLLYLESVRDPDVLADLARRAAESGKYVVAYRSTRSRTGWDAASRHTGAGTSTTDRLDAALPTGSHLLHADSLDELIDLGQLARADKVVAGPRLGVISNSGGLGVMTADAATAEGFRLDDLATAPRGELSAVLPGFASVRNPVDVTAQLLNDPELLGTALPLMLADTSVDALVVALGAVGDGYDVDQIHRDLVAAHRDSAKPVVVIWVGSRVDVRRRLGAEGIPVFDSVPAAIRALARLRSAGQEISTPRPGPARPRFTELFIGATYRSEPATVPAEALDAYAAAALQTGDDSNVHVDAGAARAAGHPERVVSGLHTLTYVTILGERIGLWAHSSVLAGYDDVRFTAAFYQGEALQLTMEVAELKPLVKRPGTGLVTFTFTLARPDTAGAAEGMAETTPVVTGRVRYLFGAG